MREPSGLVYFIQCRDNGFIKIGHTSQFSMRNRLLILCGQRRFPEPVTVEILGLIRGGFSEERFLHRVFAKSARPGAFPLFGRECFAPTRHLRGFIRGLRRHDETGLVWTSGTKKQRRCGECNDLGHTAQSCARRREAKVYSLAEHLRDDGSPLLVGQRAQPFSGTGTSAGERR